MEHTSTLVEVAAVPGCDRDPEWEPPGGSRALVPAGGANGRLSITGRHSLVPCPLQRAITLCGKQLSEPSAVLIKPKHSSPPRAVSLTLFMSCRRSYLIYLNWSLGRWTKTATLSASAMQRLQINTNEP